MKKTFSLILAVAMMLTASLQAASLVTALSANSLTSVIASPSYLVSVQVANATGAAGTLRLVDTASTNQTYVRAAFTVPFTYATNIVSTFTNINGVVTSITNAAYFTVNTSVANATNYYNSLNVMSVPANSTITWYPVNGAFTHFGLCATNDAALTITTTYAPLN